jgi:hypothetical protein
MLRHLICPVLNMYRNACASQPFVQRAENEETFDNHAVQHPPQLCLLNSVYMTELDQLVYNSYQIVQNGCFTFHNYF